MIKSILMAAIAANTILALTACNKDEQPHVPVLEGLTLENFPVMDGSTSTKPLIDLAAAKLLGYNGGWADNGLMKTGLPRNFYEQKLLCNQTHGSILNLIDGGTDMIFVARTLSADEKVYAEQKGVTLIEKPIALDAMVFIAHSGRDYANPVATLTQQQVQGIYTAEITNWNEVGGDDLPIVPFIRNANSGSQELMESLVMDGPVADGFWEDHFDESNIIGGMVPLFTAVGSTKGGLGYTVYFFLWKMMAQNSKHIKTLAIDGVTPNKTTIADRSYPFTAEVYLMIHSDLDRGSAAYKVYEYLFSAAGQNIVAESGYVPVPVNTH